MEIFRFNSEDYPQRVGVRIDPAMPFAAQLLLSDDRQVSIGAARGVWLRRPQWPEIADAVTDPHDRQLALQESVATAAGLWRLLEDRCVSPADALQAARWKLPQLQRARGLGFAVPATLVTTSAALARAFVANGPTVIKAVHDAYARVGAVLLTGMTERVVSPAGLADLQGIDGVCPVMLQREVAKHADYRVTVIGAEVFAVRMTAPEGAPIDIRAVPPGDCTSELAKLPPPVEAACIRFVRDAGLRFGAIDLVQDRSGSFWFLECNPNGQWGWLEVATGAPMTSALVDLLLDPATQHRALEPLAHHG